ncbi:MAG: hypothetical protein Q9M43_10760 [Sulfurimonas sp.]|nr:hypothetical protein [Sulfurimonas sp.]
MSSLVKWFKALIAIQINALAGSTRLRSGHWGECCEKHDEACENA